MKNNYSILVNTTDRFDDCWEPFFKLFKLFWPEYEGKIYLNTEYKEYTYPGLNIISVKNSEIKNDGHLITWSECLQRALDIIDTDTVLYLQEDYFLKSPVDSNTIQRYADLLKRDNLKCIHLTDQNSLGPFSPSIYPDLWEIDFNTEFRLSCQAALWDRNVLNSYVRKHETAWQFEQFGTIRSSIFKDKFHTVNRDIVKLGESEIIPYLFTGVIQGQWKEDVIDLFSKHDIKVDFAIRGFHKPGNQLSLFQRLKKKWHRLPREIQSNLELVKLRISK